MREILFRGKRLDTKEWVTGYPFHGDVECNKMIVVKELTANNKTSFYSAFFDVDPESIGQYTGREDINGEKLFEGDIVQVRDVWFPPEDTEDLSLDQIDEIFFKEEIPGGYDKEITKYPGSHHYRYHKNYQVVWSKKRVQFELKNDRDIQPLYDGQRFTIIGNAIDNPELLKK